MRIVLLLLFLTSSLFAAPAAAQTPAATTTIILVRHAEKAARPEADPPLTAEGRARALALAEALEDADIDAIYSTQYVRTRATVEPLSDEAGVEVTIVGTGDGLEAYIGEVAERARTEHPGRAVVIVGHSNTLGRTIAALGGPDDLGDLPDDVHDTMYVLLLQEGRAPRLVRARYGAPNGNP